MSSVKAFDKRDGSGAYNWGTPGDELAVSVETEETPVEVDAEVVQDAEVLSGDENKENAEEEAAVQMTLDEYKKSLDDRSKPEFNLRKPNEGEKLKGLKQLHSKPTEEEKEQDGSLFFPKKYYEERLKTSGRVHQHMDHQLKYGSGDNRHLDTERGGRGRGRGRGGGRDSDRNDSPVESGGFGGGFGSAPVDDTIALDNDADFPSLG